MERRIATWDGYVDVRGNRYSIPDDCRGQMVTVRIGLDGTLRVFHDEERVATHRLRPFEEGWASVPSFHARLCRETLNVEHRDLAVYEEVASCSS